MTTSPFVWSPFAYSIIFHPSLWVCLSLGLRWISWRWYILGSLFLNHPATLWLLNGGLNPFTFTFTGIINIWGLICHFISCFVLYLHCLFLLCVSAYFGFLWWFAHFPFLYIMCSSFRFLFCGCYEVCIKQHINNIVIFLLKGTIFICLYSFHYFPSPFLYCCCHKLSHFTSWICY